MSYKNNNKQNFSNKNKKQTKYKQKQYINIKAIKGKTHYIPILPTDALYRENLFKLYSKQYQSAIQTILMDLNALLYLDQQDFFQQLQSQNSLRNCLQSCLMCLCKNSMYKLNQIKKQSQSALQECSKALQNKYFLLYDKLHDVILKIYLRITHTTNIQHKQIIYNSWLLDIPKMIDLALTYVVKVRSQEGIQKYINQQIIRKVIEKAIQSNSNDYVKDFDDFVNILYQSRIPLILNDVTLLINLSEQSMIKAKGNFANPLRSFLISGNKILAGIKDLFTSLLYIYLCFPQILQSKLATDHQIQQCLLKIFIQFVQNTPQWNTAQFKPQFQMNFADIKKSMCQYFYQNFKIIQAIIHKGDQPLNNTYSRAINTYSVYCLYLTSQKIDRADRQACKQLFQTIMLNFSQTKNLFFLQQAPNSLKFINLTEQQKMAIVKCHKFGSLIEQELFDHRQMKQHQQAIKKRIDKFFIKAEVANIKNMRIQFKEKAGKRKQLVKAKNSRNQVRNQQQYDRQNDMFKKGKINNAKAVVEQHISSTKNKTSSQTTIVQSQKSTENKAHIGKQQSQQQASQLQQQTFISLRSQTSNYNKDKSKQITKSYNQHQQIDFNPDRKNLLDLSFDCQPIKSNSSSQSGDQQRDQLSYFYQETEDNSCVNSSSYGHNGKQHRDKYSDDLSFCVDIKKQNDYQFGTKKDISENSTNKIKNNIDRGNASSTSFVFDDQSSYLHSQSSQQQIINTSNILDDLNDSYSNQYNNKSKSNSNKVRNEHISPKIGSSKNNDNIRSSLQQQNKSLKTNKPSNQQSKNQSMAKKVYKSTKQEQQACVDPQMQKLYKKRQQQQQLEIYKQQQNNTNQNYWRSPELIYEDDYDKQIKAYRQIQARYEYLQDFFTVVVEGDHYNKLKNKRYN